jgi:hypothetical protein
MKKTLISISLFLSLFSAAQAPNANQAVPVANILENQFTRLKSKANNYKEHNREFKVIEVNQLNAFWNGVLSTVQNHEAELLKGGKNSQQALEQANATIASQNVQIASLKQENTLKEKAVQLNAYEVNNIIVLGIGINKQLFLILSSGVIIGLGALSLIMLSLYKKNKKITDEKIQAFQEIDNEFNEFRKAARERELKIKRELQTELNHKEEMRLQLASLQK